jgi:hypothetical protein
MSLTATLLFEINAYLQDNPKMSERQFGLTVAGNHKFLQRLRSGFGVNSTTADRVRAHIAGNEMPPRAQKKRAVTSQAAA